MGFDRFYGFLGGETNNWYPDLVEDNHYIEAPYTPEEGYHLSKDLADQAITMIRDQQSSNPSKPWYMWFCPGANHAPHHSPKEYADKYKGMFDDGYDAYREWVLQRMIEKGIMPADTELTPFNPIPEEQANPIDWVKPWEECSDDEKKLFSRMAEVFAGFSEYTDAQVGRVIDYLETTGQLENTIVLYCADNGASGEEPRAARSTRTSTSTTTPTTWPRTSRCSTNWARPTPTTITPPGGRSHSRRRSRCSSGMRSTPAAPATR